MHISQQRTLTTESYSEDSHSVAFNATGWNMRLLFCSETWDSCFAVKHETLVLQWNMRLLFCSETWDSCFAVKHETLVLQWEESTSGMSMCPVSRVGRVHQTQIAYLGVELPAVAHLEGRGRGVWVQGRGVWVQGERGMAPGGEGYGSPQEPSTCTYNTWNAYTLSIQLRCPSNSHCAFSLDVHPHPTPPHPQIPDLPLTCVDFLLIPWTT